MNRKDEKDNKPGEAVALEFQFGKPNSSHVIPGRHKFYGGDVQPDLVAVVRDHDAMTVVVGEVKRTSQGKTHTYSTAITYHVHGSGVVTRPVASAEISRPPGFGIRVVADFLCSLTTMQKIVEPAIADMQHEVFEALKEGRPAKAKWCEIRGHWGIIRTLAIVNLVRRVVEFFKVKPI